MSQFYPFVVVGLVAGSIYGMTAVGLVLTYRTSGIFNFAHGAIAAANAYVFYELREGWSVPWPVAAVLCVLLAAPVMGIALERLAKALATATTASRVVATVGLLVAIQGLLSAAFGASTRQFRPFLPQHVWSVGSVNVGTDQVLTFVIAVGVTALLAGLLRSRLGIAMRGVVDDPELLDLAGTNPARIRRRAWMIGASVAGVSGILIAPTLGLDSVLLTFLVVQAFGAAAIGRFRNIPWTFAGGLVVGVGSSLATKYVGRIPVLAGFPASFPFIVLFVVLLFMRRGGLTEFGTSPRPLTPRRPLSVRVRAALGVGLVALALLVPAFAGVRLTSYTEAVIFALIFASLRLLVVTSGQVSLSHAAFAAVGAAAFSHLAGGQGWPWLVALVAAGLVAVPVGAVLAIPAVRLSGVYLALATFGFGILLQRLVYPTRLMFGDRAVLHATRPAIGGLHLAGDKAFYFVCVVIVAVVVALLHGLTRSRLGRLLRALADSPTSLSVLGDDVNLLRLLVFCVSAFTAALGGALFAAFIQSPGPNSFDAFLSLTLLTVLAIAGRGELSGPVVAAGVFVLVPAYVQSAAFTRWLPVMFGVIAIAAVTDWSDRASARLHRAAEQARTHRSSSPVRHRLEAAGRL